MLGGPDVPGEKLSELVAPAATAAATTISSATATAAATTAAATTTATGGAIFARARFVHGQCPALKLSAVQFLDRSFCALFGRHSDEREAAGFARVSVHHYFHFADRPMLRKRVLKLIFSDIPGQISDE